MISNANEDSNPGEETSMNYTIDAIAKELGLSKTTVSRAISGKGRISESTRQRVADFIKEINYMPSAVARSLAASKTFNIGLIFPQDSTLDEMPYFQDVMVGVCEAALDHDYDVLNILADNNDIHSLDRAITNKKIDGLIVSRCIKDSRVIEYLKDKELPYVVLGNPLEEGILYVDNDNKTAARRMMEALIDQHMKKFALVGGNESFFVTQSRLEGYLEGLNKRGIEVNENLIFLNAHRGERLKSIVSTILENEVDCIVCMDDVLCNNTLLFLQTSGVSVPKDVKLVSYYDSKLLLNHTPSITSLYFDSKYLGAQGVDVLMRKIDGKVAQSRILTDFNLQMRESTR